MDALKAEIASKRKILQDDPVISLRPTKYMRRGDIERLKEEQELKLREENERREEENTKAAGKKAADQKAYSRSSSDSPAPGSSGSRVAGSPVPPESQFNISNEETVRRLRQKGQPIRLFAESDKERRLRLRALELIEERGTERHGGQNDFKKALEDVENVGRELDAKNKGGKKTLKDEVEQQVNGVLDLGLVKSDPDKLYPIIYYALKRTLKEWEEAMDKRPEHIKRSTQGKLAAATQVQSAEYLKPLFKTLRSRSLPPDVLLRMSEIVHYMQNRQYQRANDSYLRLSIGNAPWPIGVTMVGIHERSAREKISSDQVAHVLNDEVSRKYIQSLKRLLTFSQTKYPPEDVSQLMG
jgi:pre-mRNA-splicing factor 18